MPKRLLLLLLPLPILAAAAAGAAEIDPGLAAALAGKAAGERVSVMMLMHDRADLSALESRLEGADPATRRKTVVAALKDHAAASQAEALSVLRAAESRGDATRIRTLWMVNAVAFEGDRDVVDRLAATKAPAVLVHDRPYDMIGAVSGANAVRPGDLPLPAPTASDTAWGVKWVKANRVWLDLGYDGSGIVVGHFDTGVWLTHPDIVNRLWVNPGEIAGNGIDDDGNGYVDDVNGYDFADGDSDPNDDVVGTASNHGTHTAGTVCGDGTNGTITGVAPGASVMVCKSFLSDGSGAPFSAIYEGQQYAIEMGARVFTMSLGVAGSIPASLMRAERENADAIRTAGVIFFNSAGNDHATYNPPLELGVTARVPAPWNPIAGTLYSSRGGVMAVGGTGYKNNTIYSGSSWGPADWGDVPPWYDWADPPGLTKPDVCAPGVGINSLQKPSGYSGDTWTGTSMACPHAAGVAALMLQKNPSLSPAGVDSIMEQTALDLGAVGKDNTFGSGQLNALAAVNAVPTAQTPHVVISAQAVDASGDGILDPGETAGVVFELRNNSPVTDALSVTGGLDVVANPYVTVTDGSASYGTIAQDGGVADNAGDAFQIAIAPGAPQGYEFTLLLTVAAQNGYQVTYDVGLFVGLPSWLTHDVGAIHATVTDQGIIGYMDDSATEGTGFGPIDGGSALYLGSLWGGNASNYICNRDYPGTVSSPETYEWVVRESPNGRMQDVGPLPSIQHFTAAFTDSGAAYPAGVTVTQDSHAWSSPGNDDFIVLTYTFHNTSASAISNYYAGVFCDWDIGTYDTNEGATDAARKLTYMYTSGGAHYGMAIVSGQSASNLSLINNPTYVYTNGHIDDGTKLRFLMGTYSTPTTTGPDDWSAVTATGPFTIGAGAELVVAFALVRGDDLADLQANTDAAAALYAATPVDGPTPTLPGFALRQNLPNPFNPATAISFSLEQQGPVSLRVFDIGGRQVRTLIAGECGPGEHRIVWDGRDDAGQPQPSGLYFYRLDAGGRSLARKMMLVK